MLRNFFHTIRHFKAAFILNVLGLAVAFAASLMIMMQVRYDLTFDTCYEDAENIYRLDMKSQSGEEKCVITRPLARMFTESSPHILNGCIMTLMKYGGMYRTSADDSSPGIYLHFQPASSGFPHVFGLTMLDGNLNALETPNSVIIPASMSMDMFGTVQAVGNVLYGINVRNATVAGVYRDFPRNATLKNVIYSTFFDPQENYDNWQNSNYSLYIKLESGADPDLITENFIKNSPVSGRDGEDLQLSLRPLDRLHFIQDISFDASPKTSRAMIYSLISIVIVLIVIAGINFNNFSISIAPMRFRNIAARRILGSSLASIRTGIVCETVTVTVLAYILALGVLYLCRLTPVTELIDADISFVRNPGIISAGAVVAMITGIIAGIYPAFYLTAFSPAGSVKGNMGLSRSGKRVRTTLLCIQFTAAFILMTVALFLLQQNRYMLDAPLGFDKDEILVCETSLVRNKINALQEELKKIPGVENTGCAQAIPGSSDYYMYWSFPDKERYIGTTAMFVSPSFMKVMGIDIIDGRDFRESDYTDMEYQIGIFNETAGKQYGLFPGEILGDWLQVIGICDDIKFSSLRKEITPIAFILSPKDYQYSHMFIRILAGTDLKAARQAVENCLEKFYPGYPLPVRFYDSVLEDAYQKEQRTGSLVALFSLIALVISVVGVFSLVSFECGYRRKESAIRKVVGATSGELVWMFCRKYLSILCICFIVSIPFSVIVVQRWLEGFAYHIPLYWWVFPLVLLAITVVTLATVIWQSWSAASENPVDNLRTE